MGHDASGLPLYVNYNHRHLEAPRAGGVARPALGADQGSGHTPAQSSTSREPEPAHDQPCKSRKARQRNKVNSPRKEERQNR